MAALQLPAASACLLNVAGRDTPGADAVAYGTVNRSTGDIDLDGSYTYHFFALALLSIPLASFTAARRGRNASCAPRGSSSAFNARARDRCASMLSLLPFRPQRLASTP